MSRLSPSEREVILALADDEEAWHVFTESTRLTRKILVVAARWGVTPQRLGEGYEFALPLRAVRFVGPVRLSEGQRAARREAARKARATRGSLIQVQAAERSPAALDAEAVREPQRA